MGLPQGYVLDGTDQKSAGVPSGYVLDGQASPASTSSDPANTIERNYEAYKGAAQVTTDALPWNQINKGLKTIGGDIAEAGGNAGARVANAGFPVTGKVIQGAGVLAGAVPAIGPEFLAAYSSLRGLYNPENPIAAGLTNSTKDLSPQYAAQNKALGISNDVPETASNVKYQDPYQYPSQLSKPNGQAFPKPKLQLPAESGTGAAQPLPGNIPTKYPNDPGTLINHINDAIDLHGHNVPLQQLQDYKELLSTKMSPINGEIPQGTPLFAKATQTAQKINSTINQVSDPLLQKTALPQGTLPTRTALNQAYSIAAKRQQAADFIKHYSAMTGKVAGAAGGIGSAAYELYRHLNGDSGHGH